MTRRRKHGERRETETVFGSYYSSDGKFDESKLPDNREFLADGNIHPWDSSFSEKLGQDFHRRLQQGERLLLVGFLATTHNSGVSLLEATRESGIRILLNNEEERFSGIKHFAGYPAKSVQALKAALPGISATPSDIYAVLYAWDVVEEEKCGMKMLMTNGKIINNEYYRFVSEQAHPTDPSAQTENEDVSEFRESLFFHSPSLKMAFGRLVRDLGLRPELPCVQMLHHENHAYFSYGVSPFYQEDGDEPVMIACIDGGGDLSSVSLFKAKGSSLRLIKRCSRANSLGVYYMLCSSLLGGWTALSSEGRYMGAAAWGNNNRATNPYYKRLRQYFYFDADGEFHVNTAMSEHGYAGLQSVVGKFLPPDEVWNPDAVIDVDEIQHSEITRTRVDVAAAVQMVFEDVLFHLVAYLIEETGSDKLVLCGGTALNCVANMRLLDSFDETYFERYTGKRTRLHLWIPPTPSDQGVVIGAPYQFAMRNGARAAGNLPSPFLCGMAASDREIECSLARDRRVLSCPMGSINDPVKRGLIADWMAYLVANDCVVGIFQGAAETGPRALGHRSILSNPCNPKVLELLNSRVKLREKVRPLAPMLTLEAARELYELSPGASDAHWDAYDYMVLTARANSRARQEIPAVVHHDGTSRIQIVRVHNNPLMHEYLTLLKHHIGVEVSVNTSLNVGSPIVQSPEQALEIFNRTKGLDGIVFVGESGQVYMAWPQAGVQEYESRVPGLRATYAYRDELFLEPGQKKGALRRRRILGAVRDGAISTVEARSQLLKEVEVADRSPNGTGKDTARATKDLLLQYSNGQLSKSEVKESLTRILRSKKVPGQEREEQRSY